MKEAEIRETSRAGQANDDEMNEDWGKKKKNTNGKFFKKNCVTHFEQTFKLYERTSHFE